MNNAELPPSGDELWDNSRTVQNCIRHAAICLLITAIEVNFHHSEHIGYVY